jgi:hypothetical protein
VSYATPQHYTDTTDAIDPPELLRFAIVPDATVLAQFDTKHHHEPSGSVGDLGS